MNDTKTTLPESTRFMRSASRTMLILAAMIGAVQASPSRATGHIDASTLVSTSHGSFGGVAYTRYEAMFEGEVGGQRQYRVPCQIVAPTNPGSGSGLLLFDWLVQSTIVTAVGQEQADARYTMTDEFLFGLGTSYATVRCNPEGLGKRSPVSDHTLPWSDGLLDTSSEFIMSAGDEYDIVVDYVKALGSDPVALEILGDIERTAAFGYSASGARLRGLLRINMGRGLFDFSLVGGVGNGYDHPAGNKIAFSKAEKAPIAGAGLEIDFLSETDVLLLEGQTTRHEEPNYRAYEFAGASHIRAVDVEEFGLADPASANPADWVPFIRALFVAGNAWVDGEEPPPSLWLGAPDDASIARDSNGNALVRHVGQSPVNSTAYRLPEVAVGENQYIPHDPSFLDGTFLGVFRAIAGSHVDLTDNFTSHPDYVLQVETHARGLQDSGYLLEADADAIIERASLSDIGT